jgi:hypothetical protein
LAAADGPAARRSALAALGPWRRPLVLLVIAGLVLAALTYVIGFALDQYRDAIARSGRSADPRPVAITIAGESLAIPANMIRFAAGRRPGPADRVELLLHWPGFEGYSEALADAFKDDAPEAPLFFVSITPRDSPLDSDDRLDAVYSRFFVKEMVPGPAGLVGRYLSEDSGYGDEIVYFAPAGGIAFVARCLARATAEIPATCLRDINLGHNLSALYRFNRDYLGDWRSIDAGLRRRLAGFLSPD